jgi:hypothetical protein
MAYVDSVENARRRFHESPLGAWASYLGGGEDMLIGMSLTFHNDGTGTMNEWGFDHHHINPNYVNEPKFSWRPMGERTIELTHRGDTRTICYDFKITKNEYGMEQLRIFEAGREPDKDGEVGFWISPFSLVWQPQQGKKFSGIVELFFKMLKVK